MGLFGFGKKKEVVDLGERYRKQQEKLAQQKTKVETSQTSESGEGNALGFLSSFAKVGSENSQKTETETGTYTDLGESIEQRRQRLTKRLMEMTNRIEELSNQTYHLQQRVELLEKKMDINVG